MRACVHVCMPTCTCECVSSVCVWFACVGVGVGVCASKRAYVHVHVCILSCSCACMRVDVVSLTCVRIFPCVRRLLYFRGKWAAMLKHYRSLATRQAVFALACRSMQYRNIVKPRFQSHSNTQDIVQGHSWVTVCVSRWGCDLGAFVHIVSLQHYVYKGTIWSERYYLHTCWTMV